MDALAAAGHPVIRIAVNDAYDLGEEFFRWEVATAVAGSIIGIDPFNQPDVEASKIETRKLTDEFEKTGSLPKESPAFEDDGIKVFGDAKGPTLVDALRAHLATIKPGDYFALLAYVEMNDAHRGQLQSMREKVRDTKRVATCLGFGPRFLHSTGQAYKGGPNTGVFLQITADDAQDLAVPGQKYTFGIVKAAQARGDLAGSGRTRPPRAAHSSGSRCTSGTEETGFGDGPRATIENSTLIGPVAQLVEHRTFNAVVAGSSPARLTKSTIVRTRHIDNLSSSFAAEAPPDSASASRCRTPRPAAPSNYSVSENNSLRAFDKFPPPVSGRPIR